MNPANKQYGLCIPKKKQSTFKASNVFGDDSDEETPKQEINASLQKSSLQAKIKRQTQIEIDKALEADPTVYEYDTIYDDLKARKEEKESAIKQKKDKKPKYIAGLLKAAETRKKEDERRAERKIQKEREKEGHEFDDKEVFVTGAYKKKMQELQEQEEKERREAAMEDMLDVKKQRDLSGFYRYMLNEQVGEPVAEEKTDTTEVKVKEEPGSPQRLSKEEGRSLIYKTPRDSTNRSGRSSSRDRGRRRDSSSSSGDRFTRERTSEETTDNHRKRSHSPVSHKHRRRDSPRADRDRGRGRSHERDSPRSDRDRGRGHSHRRDSRMDKEGYSRGDNSDSEGSDRDRRKSRVKEDEGRSEKHRDTEKLKVDRKRSPERGSEKEREKKAKLSDETQDSKDNKKSSVVAKKTTDSAANEAKKRYLERKLAKERAKLNQQD
ncbi:uncharacterized protein LOC111135927 [Crassostrea virginica]